MGAKKQAVKSKKVWIKALAIIAGVLFVGTDGGISHGFKLDFIACNDKTRRCGGFGLYPAGCAGDSDPDLEPAAVHPAHQPGFRVLYSKPLTITANQSLDTTVYPNVYPIQFYTASTGWSASNQFALFRDEYDTISSGIVGMKANSQKTISLATAKPMTQLWSAEQSGSQ